MASLVKKIIRGHPYYYLRVCERVDGKPKIVSQTYLGRADSILQRLQAAPVPQPLHARVREFGASAALLALARRLGLPEIIDRYAPKRGSAPSVGSCLLAAILNRCLAPCSKAALANWYRSTALPRLLPLPASQLSSQRFWEHLQRIPADSIPLIERDFVARLTREFDVDLGQVLFDATNFFTYIDSFNTRSSLAQRGHSKEGRKSLRIVGLALLVSADGRLPLLHRTYPGNRPDAPTFSSLAEELARRCRELTDAAQQLTLVFDKGNNSQDNLELVAQGPFHFIGSLVPTQHPDLLAVPAERLVPLAHEGLPGVRAWRTRKTVFGVERTVLVTFNQALFDAQKQTLEREIGQRREHFRDLQGRLRRWRTGTLKGGRKPTLAGTRKRIDRWLAARHMRDLFAVTLAQRDGLPELRYRFRQSAWQQLQRELLGKTLLFTDNDDWSDAELVRGYRAQHHVESAFRQLKDTDCIAIRPQYHWTDHSIRVHVLCCVLALTLCCLLQRELARLGVDASIPTLLRDLAGICEVDVVYAAAKTGAEPVVQTTLTEMSAAQESLYGLLQLAQFRA